MSWSAKEQHFTGREFFGATLTADPVRRLYAFEHDGEFLCRCVFVPADDQSTVRLPARRSSAHNDRSGGGKAGHYVVWCLPNRRSGSRARFFFTSSEAR